MNLSDLISGSVKSYLEYGWVCAPNAAAQTVALETLTTLTIDTEVSDVGGFGSVAANQVTLAAGTYSFEAVTRCSTTGFAGLFGLYNVTSSSFVTRTGPIMTGDTRHAVSYLLTGQMTLSVPTTLELRLLASAEAKILNSAGTGSSSDSTAGVDQRTTLKLWKLS